MKKLIIGLTLIATIGAQAKSLSSYINDQIDEVCSTGDTITLNQLDQTLKNLDINEADGCKLYSSKIYPSIESAGMISNDDFTGRLLAIKLLSENNAHIDANSLTMRDIDLCVKRYDNGDMTVGYEINSQDNLDFPQNLLASKTHRRISIIQIRNNKIKWAGQEILNYKRTNLIGQSYKSNYFQCGKKE